MSNKKIYWKSLEEKFQTPEYLKSKDNEFSSDLPVDEFLGSDKLSESSTGRRDFLKFMGFSVAAATLAACEAPVIKSIPYVNKPEDITPGIANWYSSAYWDGNDYGSILIKTREGRPIFVKGNKENGITASSPRVLASVLSLYNSDRLKNPTIEGQDASWSDLDSKVIAELNAVAARGGNIRILTNSVISPSLNLAINQFKSTYSGSVVETPVIADEQNQLSDSTSTAAVDSSKVMNIPTSIGGNANVEHIIYDAISYAAIRKANQDSFGKSVIPDYDFSKAKTIVSIGADFMANWLLSADYLKGYAQNRKPENGWMSRHFQYETVMTITGSKADVRVPIKPSEEGLIAAALLSHITGENAGLSIPQEIKEATKDAAKELKENKGASLVVAGSNDYGVQMIVNAINNALLNYGATIDLDNTINIAQADDTKVKDFVSELKSGKVDALIIYGSNPVYSMPNGSELAEAIKAVKTSISIAQYADETVSNTKYVAADNHYMESWMDYNPRSYEYAIAQPVIRPLHNTSQALESFLVWSGKAQRGGKDSLVSYDFIKSTWEKYGFPMQTEYTTFEDYWNWSVHNGSSVGAKQPINSVVFSGDLSKAKISIEAKIASANEGTEVLFYQKAGIGDGQQAANPWLQEMPDPLSKVTWDNYITMSPSEMEEKGYNMFLDQEHGASVLKVTIGSCSFELPVYPSPGQKVGTIGIALGYGRGANQEKIGKSAYQTGEYGSHLEEDGKLVPIGKNVFCCADFNKDGMLTYSSVASLEATGKDYILARTQIHGTAMERTSVVKETTLGVYKSGDKHHFNHSHELIAHENGKAVKKNVKEFDLWQKHPVENVGHRWGMTIDLNSCIGCGSCIIACHTENNVPVVGKDEVRRGRDMHWMRLDRYYSSAMTKKKAKEEGVGAISMYSQMERPEDNPQVVHMPMMCQHCNHAPCETVCPVAATTHSNEGLNQMTYNRCIGTRYCANNCPYKVRRFNWFNYQAYKKFQHSNPSQDDLGRMVLNPDVTVRSRGVMEKCSMCVQRIQEGKLVAKKDARPVMDGEVQSACSDACPTDAIQFGDLNDTKSLVSMTSKSDRAYTALEEVGVDPNIYYQVLVRNVEENEHHTEAHVEEGHKEEAH